MGKLGYDIEVSKMTPDELAFSQQALKDYEVTEPGYLAGRLL